MNRTNHTNEDNAISINTIINKNSKYSEFQRMSNYYICICILNDDCLNNDQSFGGD